MNTLDYILKKYNLNPGTQYFVEIPNMGRIELAGLFAELGFNIGAEIGVYKGEYSNILCKANPNLKLYGVDPYRLAMYELGLFNDTVKQELFTGFYEQAKKVLAPYLNYKFVLKESMEAVKDFEDESLDFVYIDANHDFPSFTNDLHYWLKKIRSGGIMSGHDYAYYPPDKFNHVKRVLEAYTKCYQMHPYFVVGAEAKGKGVIRDRYRSWFWVKQ